MGVLSQLQKILNYRSVVTKQHFLAIYTHLHNTSQQEAAIAYTLAHNLPYSNNVEDDCINKVAAVYDYVYSERAQRVNQNMSVKFGEYDIRKVYVMEQGELKDYVFDLLNKTDMLAYAQLINTGVDVVAILPKYDEIYKSKQNNDQTLHIFAGDVFDAHDKYWSTEKSNLYVCTRKENYQKLIYIKGQGYLHKNKPNIDTENNYNKYALTLYEYTYMGNIYVPQHLSNLS